MSAIMPNTVVRFGVTNLPSNYSDTFYFDSLNSQKSAMMDMCTNVFTKYTYQREHRNYLKIETTSEQDADKWDYLMFQNTAYGDKWFYAFIIETEWINNLTVKVHYEIDYIQTYFFEYRELQCFIERSHTDSDNIGENIEPEPVTIPTDRVTNETHTLDDMVEGYSVFVVADSIGTRLDETYVAAKIYAFPPQTAPQTIASFISGFIASDDIIVAYKVPSSVVALYDLNNTSHEIERSYGYDTGTPGTNLRPYRFTYAKPTTSTYLDGYKPKNNKLYTYPYTMGYITDNNGNDIPLVYEFFKGNNAVICLDGTILPSPRLVVYPDPSVYKVGVTGIPSLRGINYETITLDNFTMIGWSFNALQQYLAREMTSNTIRVLANATLSIPTSAATTAMTGSRRAGIATAGYMARQTANSVIEMMTNQYEASISGEIVRGTFSSSSPMTTGKYHLLYGMTSLKSNVLIKIDNFFTKFGYAINRLDTPSRNNRTRYTYVKTADCVVAGNLPAGAKRIIQDAYDNGIRFWKDYEGFMTYGNPNEPLY